jgi:hypothetical protein
MTGLKLVLYGSAINAGCFAHYGLGGDWVVLALEVSGFFCVMLGLWIRDGWTLERPTAP